MCMLASTPQAPQLPPEYAQAKAPDAGAVRSTTGRRATDKVRSGTQTMLTGGSGVTQVGATEKKTLLGQ